ncbi:MAG: N-(5'-phosphoribosyl)anthranilate isomerase [Pseudomonadota bacterium]
MSELRFLLPADVWMQKIFDVKAAREGGVVRRSVKDVEQIIGRNRFQRELQRRGYHAVENAGQIVIFCNNDRVRILC